MYLRLSVHLVSILAADKVQFLSCHAANVGAGRCR